MGLDQRLAAEPDFGESLPSQRRVGRVDLHLPMTAWAIDLDFMAKSGDLIEGGEGQRQQHDRTMRRAGLPRIGQNVAPL